MNLPSLNTDQWIQMGMLAAAALTLLGGAVAGLQAWNKHKRRLKIHIAQVPRAPVYVYRIKFPPDEAPEIKSVGIWVQFEIYNHGESAVLVTGIENTNGANPPTPIIGWPVKDISFENRQLKIGGIIDLPLRLEGQNGIKFFVLSEATFTQPLGMLLFKAYGKVDPKKLQEVAVALATSCNASLSPQFAKIGLELSPLMVEILETHARLLHKADGEFSLKADYGTLPGNTALTLLGADANCAATLLITHPLEHSLEVVLADGKRMVRKLKIGRNPLWMLDKVTE